MTTAVIELLKLKIAPEHQEQFIHKDAEIWTQALVDCPGLGKEVWVNSMAATEVIEATLLIKVLPRS